MSIRPDSPPQDGRQLPEIELFEGLLELAMPSRHISPASYSFSPLVSWLITTTQPTMTAELGPGDRSSLLSTCDALGRTGRASQCLAVRLPTPGPPDVAAFGDLVRDCAERSPFTVRGYADEEAARAELPAPEIDLLHLSLFDLDETALPDLTAWLDACRPGAVLAVTTTDAGISPAFAAAAQAVGGRFPSARVPLGGGTEAVVAQVPVDGSVPTVELLRSVPTAVANYLAVLSEPVHVGGPVGDDPLSAREVRAIVASLLERQIMEREALLTAMQAYKAYAAGLSGALVEVRKDLAQQTESARLEREHLVGEFLDRLDVLSAKISTSASRFAAELAEKDVLLHEQEQKVLTYAGHAANAQSVVDDIRGSSSWRLTAPLRLFSRLMARRTADAVD